MQKLTYPSNILDHDRNVLEQINQKYNLRAISNAMRELVRSLPTETVVNTLKLLPQKAKKIEGLD